MSKRKDKEFLAKDNTAMSQIESLANANYISSPYYRTYLNATRNQSMGGIPYSTISGGGRNTVATMSTARPKSGKKMPTSRVAGYKRRRGFLFLMAIFMIAILGVAVLGYLGNIVPEYISAFNKVDGEETIYLGLTDPVLGALKKFAKMDMDSHFYGDYLENMEQASIMDKVVSYGMPASIALSAIFAFIIFIATLAAFFKKSIRKGYVAKRTRLGLLSFLLFLFTLIITAAAIMWNGEGFGEAIAFFTNSAKSINAGYGLLGVVALSLLNLIFSWCTFKKVKR